MTTPRIWELQKDEQLTITVAPGRVARRVTIIEDAESSVTVEVISASEAKRREAAQLLDEAAELEAQ